MFPSIRALAIALACLALLGGCRDKHEPVKPTVIASSVIA